MNENPFKNQENDAELQEQAKRLAEQERGIPEGSYDLYVTFPHRSGEMKTTGVTTLSVFAQSTREDILKNAKSWIQMCGLHNFGLRFEGGDGTALVQASLKTREGVEVMAFECRVNTSGHLVKEK